LNFNPWFDGYSNATRLYALNLSLIMIYHFNPYFNGYSNATQGLTAHEAGHIG